MGYYTNKQEKKRPRKIHFSPKAVLVFKINSPSVSAVMAFLTHTAALGRFQNSKNLSASTSMGKRKITSKAIATYPSFQKLIERGNISTFETESKIFCQNIVVIKFHAFDLLPLPAVPI